MESYRADYPIADYSVSQTTLDQVINKPFSAKIILKDENKFLFL